MADIGLFEATHSARALRRFKPDPVPDDLITKVLDAAIRAPSGSSEQNWVFVVVKDGEQRKRISAIYKKAGAVMMPFLDRRERPASLSEKQYNQMMTGARYLFENMHEAPVLLFACLKTLEMWYNLNDLPADVQAAAKGSTRIAGSSIYPAVQNIILACRGLGLATVLTTIHTLYEDEVKRVLELPSEIQTYALLPIGYPRDRFGPVRRQPVEQVAFRDRFGKPWSA
jgi:nitroreductase